MRTYLLRRWRVEDRRHTADAAALQVVTDAARIQGPVWPVFLAGAALFYLWWLAVLTFDLAFIWHLYIKNEAAEEYIEQRLHSTDRHRAAIDRSNSRAGGESVRTVLLRLLRIRGAVMLSIIGAAVLAHAIGIGKATEHVELSGEMMKCTFALNVSVIPQSEDMVHNSCAVHT